eukprot:gene1595-32983_t
MASGEDFESSNRETLLDVVIDKLAKAGKVSMRHASPSVASMILGVAKAVLFVTAIACLPPYAWNQKALESFTSVEKNVLFSRLIYVATTSKKQSNSDAMKEFYSSIIDKVDQTGEVTGLLIVYPSVLIHARSSTLMSLLREILGAGPDSAIAEARVVASTEDIPVRVYSAWNAAFVNTASSADVMDPADAATLVKNASEINAFVRKVGPTLSNLSESDVQRRLSAMESYYEDAPNPEVILSLVPSEEAPTMLEYLDIFDSPVNVDLDSEQVWPLPTAPRY